MKKWKYVYDFVHFYPDNLLPVWSILHVHIIQHFHVTSQNIQVIIVED